MVADSRWPVAAGTIVGEANRDRQSHAPSARGRTKEVLMKSTYTTPTITTNGEVVTITLGTKNQSTSEIDAQNKKLSGGSNLSFGL